MTANDLSRQWLCGGTSSSPLEPVADRLRLGHILRKNQRCERRPSYFLAFRLSR